MMPPTVSDIPNFIRENLPVRRLASIPEIALHVAGPASRLHRITGKNTPYWAFPWGGGLALARHVLDRPETVAGRRVLDLGSGSGLVAIAAAKAGAAGVQAAEIDPNGVAAIGLNAALNDVALALLAHDLTTGEPPDVDTVLVGDLFYAPELAACVLAFLDRCLASGIDVLIGDPWRAHLPRDRLDLLAEYRVADFGDAAASTTSAVFSLLPKSRVSLRTSDAP